MPNYQYVIDSTFQPFSFDEMLKPWVMYSNAYEKAEEEYNKLSAMERFKDLVAREGEEDAAKIYNAYADEYNKQYKDFAENGLNIGNRRALTNLRRRYKGEIGALEEAEKRLNAERDLRNQMRAKGLHMLYGDENLRLSSYLNGNTPNQYGISTEDLYNTGARIGKSLTSREYNAGDAGSTLNGYYRIWEEIKGVPPERLAEYLSSPQVQSLVENALIANGAAGNLTGHNLEQAKRQVLQGMYDSAVYEKSYKPVRDPGKMDAGEAARLAESKRQHDISLRLQGINPDTGEYDPEKSIAVQKARAIQEVKNSGKVGGSSGAAYDARNKETIMVGATTGQEYRYKDDEKSTIGRPLEDLSGARRATAQDIQRAKTSDVVIQAIGGVGNINDYEILVIPANSTKIDGSGFFWDDSTNEDIYIIKPRESKRAATDSIEGISFNSGATNDVGD